MEMSSVCSIISTTSEKALNSCLLCFQNRGNKQEREVGKKREIKYITCFRQSHFVRGRESDFVGGLLGRHECLRADGTAHEGKISFRHCSDGQERSWRWSILYISPDSAIDRHIYGLSSQPYGLGVCPVRVARSQTVRWMYDGRIEG